MTAVFVTVNFRFDILAGESSLPRYQSQSSAHTGVTVPEAHPGADRAQRPVELRLAAVVDTRVRGDPLHKVLQKYL